MTEFQASVRTFIEISGDTLPAKPTVPDADVLVLCANLIIEEALETIVDGLGLSVYLDINEAARLGPLAAITKKAIRLVPLNPPDLVEFADGASDTNYVLKFAANKLGIDLEKCDREVCRSNLTKFYWSEQDLAHAEAEGYSVTKKTLIDEDKKVWLAVVRDQSGKIQKPPTYSPANIRGIIEEQTHE